MMLLDVFVSIDIAAAAPSVADAPCDVVAVASHFVEAVFRSHGPTDTPLSM